MHYWVTVKAIGLVYAAAITPLGLQAKLIANAMDHSPVSSIPRQIIHQYSTRHPRTTVFIVNEIIEQRDSVLIYL